MIESTATAQEHTYVRTDMSERLSMCACVLSSFVCSFSFFCLHLSLALSPFLWVDLFPRKFLCVRVLVRVCVCVCPSLTSNTYFYMIRMRANQRFDKVQRTFLVSLIPFESQAFFLLVLPFFHTNEYYSVFVVVVVIILLL